MSENMGTSKDSAKKNTDSKIRITGLALDDGLVNSEREIADYLIRCGLISEKGLTDEEKAKVMQKRRLNNYHNVSSLLDRYRSLLRTYAVFCEEFEMRAEADSKADTPEKLMNSTSFFTRLCDQLDMMSAEEEKRFEATYAPQIEAGRRLEVAIKAVQYGMKIVKSESQELYNLLNITYIRGDEKPMIRDILAEMGYSGTSIYYKRLEQAKKILTKAMFGYSTNRAELVSILVYLRQQESDDFLDCDMSDLF